MLALNRAGQPHLTRCGSGPPCFAVMHNWAVCLKRKPGADAARGLNKLTELEESFVRVSRARAFKCTSV